MKPFLVIQRRLPHPGIIPGARGHKKITIPAGEQVWCIQHLATRKLYWACYLNEQDAHRCADGLVKNDIPMESLIAWNFKFEFPKRVSRPKPSDLQLSDVWNAR